MSLTVPVTWNGVDYICTLKTVEDAWAFPVGHHQQYPPEMWYVSYVHSLDGSLNNGHKHSGIDINIDVPPRGDLERTLGLSVYAVADGMVTYSTDSWSGVPMLVIAVLHEGRPLWIRYGHIIPCVMLGETVKSGDRLGTFADWGQSLSKGDHLHFDMCLDEIKRDWLTPKRWVDPVEYLKAHLSPARVDAMVAKG